jgi:hypothetical protein
LNQGEARDEGSPVSASEISGKKVPQKTTAAIPTSNRLLSRNTDSRLSRESSRRSERSESSRETISSAEPITTVPIRTSSGGPTFEAPKAWIDCRIPERTRNVPSSERAKVAQISETFQTLSMPRRSWTMIECRKAVPVSQGIRAAFSTASQAQ